MADFTDFQKECLEAHNKLRAKHGAPPMTLNKQLCDMATDYANGLAAKDSFAHASPEERKIPQGNVGENLAMEMTSSPQGFKAEPMVMRWYDEVKDYNFGNPGFNPKTGHFTQVVWKGSTELGIGLATYKSGDWYKGVLVGRYFVAGNMKGAFEQNVFPVS